ncbi:hypothetical protein N7523_004342 [Penicillium sp. IBT 18751x]|nr:hypothetical protein N7523_004342 [Penicillium sp. IBT 18751x]
MTGSVRLDPFHRPYPPYTTTWGNYIPPSYRLVVWTIQIGRRGVSFGRNLKPALIQKSIAAWTLCTKSMKGDYGILAEEWAVKAVNPADQRAMPSAIPEIMSGSSLASTQ